MKSTSLFFASVMLATFSTLHSFNVIQEHEDAFLSACCKTLDFTQPRSIYDFLHDVFSNKRYTYDYLPYNFNVHLLPFLIEGKKIQKSASYMESSLRLFYNRMKACHFISPDALSEFLDQAPALIKTCCLPYDNDLYSSMEKNMMDIFIPTFISQFSFFKSNPEEFLKKLSHDVTMMVQNTFNVENHIAQEQLKQMFVRFIELCLLKVIWSSDDQIEIWNSVKRISIQCTNLLEMHLINPDELDDLYKSLIESFCRFLDLSGSELSPAVITKMKEDVLSDDLFMFELEEQEQMLETKRERVLDVLLQTEAKIEARYHGIITDIVVC